MGDLKPIQRIPLLMLGFVSLLGGTLAGLARLGWPVPPWGAELLAYHGVLMIPAFFGTVIGLERAVALGRGWPYLAPLLSALGGFALVVGAPLTPALLLLLGGSLVFCAASVRVLRIQAATHNSLLLLAALGLALGNLLLLLGDLPGEVVGWWVLFLVLTITAERLELSRMLSLGKGPRRLLLALTAAVVAGAALWKSPGGTGQMLLGAALAGLALWLLRYDIARRTVRQQGLTRFTAVCMLTGYAWLLLAGLLLTGSAAGAADGLRDAALHALLLGFVFSMVIGHALLIFPAIVRARLPYSPLFYLPLLALQLSLALRLAGDLTQHASTLAVGGLLNALTLALLILTLLSSVLRGRRRS